MGELERATRRDVEDLRKMLRLQDAWIWLLKVELCRFTTCPSKRPGAWVRWSREDGDKYARRVDWEGWYVKARDGELG